MRVSGELQVHRMMRCIVRVVWFMNQQDGCFVARNPSQGAVKISMASQYVVHPGHPKATSIESMGSDWLLSTVIPRDSKKRATT